MKASDAILTPEDQRAMIRRAIEYAAGGLSHGERIELASPREQIAQIVCEVAASALAGERARHVLRATLSSADTLLAALDEQLEAVFGVVEAIREDREGEVRRG